ncbi:hypothetical protein AB0L65_34755 [Nonomuraea sp. NPDC052116]|uniref:hypothetical protein n=1 Tax=Nonomuraea sp. NPDC052116 TaxID=3155665 RepID=UPI00342ACA54
MRNGVRHLLGAGAGLLATPLIATGFIIGVARYRQTAAMTVDWVVLAVYVGTVVLIGVLAGSRISPLASLLPGLAFLGFIGAALVRMALGGDHRMGFDDVPSQFLEGYMALLYTWSLPTGCILLTASLFPSRWRATRTDPLPPPPPPLEAPEPPPLPKRIPSSHH